jgi:hypothetical protein
MDTTTNGYIEKTKLIWDSWVNMRLRVIHLSDIYEDISLTDWLFILLKQNIMPRLTSVGYVIDCNIHTLINCILNHYMHVYYKRSIRSQWYYRSGVEFDIHTKPPKLHNTMCHHTIKKIKANKIKYDNITSNILLEYYDCYKMPDYFWNNLRLNNSVELFADESEFADIFWSTLPQLIFGHINHEKSSANQDLANRFPCLTDSSDNIYNTIDYNKRYDDNKVDYDDTNSDL